MKKIYFYGPESSYFELANYYPAQITLDGKVWPTVEHYFQAQKTKLEDWQEKIRQAQTPDEAKKLGWLLPDYEDEEWLAHRRKIMFKAVRAKFYQNKALKFVLIKTGDATLIENSPDDTYWGLVDGIGENNMGKILMQVRSELQAVSTPPDYHYESSRI